MQVTTNSLLGLQQNNQMRLNFQNTGTLRERLSTGMRINKGADDPSGLAITSGMRATIGGLEQAIGNSLDGIKMIQTADAALNEINDMLLRGYELAVRAANDATLTTSDKGRMQAEVDALLSQIDNIAVSTEYNTRKLIDGGAGQKFTFDTQADWQAGTQFAPAGPNRLDAVTSPGDLKLALKPYDHADNAFRWVRQGDLNQNNLCMYITNYLDNGDGTADVTIGFDTEEQGAIANYNGSIQFDSGITNVATTGGMAYSGGGLFTYNLANTAVSQQRGTVSFTVDLTADAQRFAWVLDTPNGVNVSLYFGNDAAAGGPDVMANPQFPKTLVNGYLTDIYDTVTWRSSTISTGGSGGEAALSYNVSNPAGTNVVLQVYESATGAAGTWSALPLVENGGTFSYTQPFLMVEAMMISNGVSYGAPSIQDIEIQLTKGTNLQIGENNQSTHRLALSALDARSSALGVQDIDITRSTKALKSYDTYSEWASGIANISDVDYVTRSGFLQLSSPVNNQPTPSAQPAGENMYFTVGAIQRADGLFDVTMTMKCYGSGNGTNATEWLGTIDVYNGDGSRAMFTTVENISMEGLSVGWPLAPGVTSTNDVNYVDTNGNLTFDAGDQHVGLAGGSVTGSFGRIFFDYGTTSAQDGVAFSFVADSEAYINVNFDVFRNNAHVKIAEDTANITFQDQQVAQDIDGVPGSFNFVRRLSEYVPSAGPPSGDFETGAFYFGAGTVGSLEGSGLTNNPGDAVQFEIYESADGIGGWNQIMARGGGLDFTTSAGNSYLYVKGYLEGTDAVSTIGPGNGAYSYTPSTTPRIDNLRVTKDISPITEFQIAMDRISDIREELGITERRLYHVVDDLSMQRMNLLSAKSTLADANMAVEAASLAKQQILNDATTAVKAQGDPFMQSILDLEQEHNVGHQAIRTLGGQ